MSENKDTVRYLPYFHITLMVSENGDGTWSCTDPTNCFGHLIPEAAVNAIIQSCLQHNREFQGVDRAETNRMWIEEQEEESKRARAEKAAEDRAKKQPSLGIECFVYLVKDVPRGLYKIGKAVNVKSRFDQLKTANASIELVTWYKGFSSDERTLHSIFEDRRVSGEWFVLEDEQIEFIKNYFNQKRANQ